MQGPYPKGFSPTAGSFWVAVRQFLVDANIVNPRRIEVLEPGRTATREGREVVSKFSMQVARGAPGSLPFTCLMQKKYRFHPIGFGVCSSYDDA